jgi:RNA polymerase sigma-70 factor (ECF subfamily)
MNMTRKARLTAMVSEHSSFVARTLRNLGVPSRDLDDCVQRVYIVADRRLDDIRTGSERAFLFRSAAHIAAHARRSLARKREVLEEEPHPLSAPPAQPDEIAERKQAREMLDVVLAELSDELRTVFVLHSFEEMTMAEIAELLELPPGTVASRLRRARLLFRERVELLRSGAKQESA